MAMDALPYRISTITATGSVNTEINLDIFYDSLEICENDTDDGVVYAEYGKKKSETVFKGFSKKFLVNKRKVSSTTKRFDNQVTIVYRKNEKCEAFKSLLNVKVFKNGNVQITGIKYIEQGSLLVDVITDLLRKVHAEQPGVVKSIDTLANVNYNVRLINSDFRIGFPIKREWLYKVFVSQFENDCSFEPCIYPGVKIQYFYNKSNKCKDGLCHCSKTCVVGKGNGQEDGSCKKITIAVFQSGCIIITGAQSHVQINETYDFIKGILHRYRDDIEKKQAVMEEEAPVVKKIVMINKKNIIYPPSMKLQGAS